MSAEASFMLVYKHLAALDAELVHRSKVENLPAEAETQRGR